MQNIHDKNSNKKSGLPRGIYLEDGRYRARIKLNNKIKSLGRFALLDDAVKAYEKAKSINIAQAGI